jgi:hypothetical protein
VDELTLIPVLFVAASVLGILWGKEDKGEVKAVGDRVACGLFAIPLISVAVHENFPLASRGWVVVAPLPLVIYLILLALTDMDSPPPLVKQHFSRIMLGGTLLVYVGFAAFYTLS